MKKFSSSPHIFGKLNVRLAWDQISEGWLWARITTRAFPFSAATKIDFGSATVPVAAPEETS
mgnify:CR=1 FL=1